MKRLRGEGRGGGRAPEAGVQPELHRTERGQRQRVADSGKRDGTNLPVDSAQSARLSPCGQRTCCFIPMTLTCDWRCQLEPPETAF